MRARSEQGDGTPVPWCVCAADVEEDRRVTVTDLESADELAAPLDLAVDNFGARRDGADEAAPLVGPIRRQPRPKAVDRGVARDIAGSRTRDDRQGPIRYRTGQGRPALRRPRLARQPPAQTFHAGLSGRQQHRRSVVRRRRLGLAGQRAGPVCTRRAHRRALAEQQPGAQPARLQGAHRNRWAQCRPGRAPSDRRHSGVSAGAVDGGAGRIHHR